MLTFYDAPVSGNTYKVRLLLRQLKIPHEVVWLDILKGEVRGEEFRRRNPFGRVPYIDHDGFGLAESNAILLYLARGSRLLPDELHAQALIAQWMFFEQNQVESSIGIPRFLRQQGKDPAAVGEHYAPRARAALKVLEQHFSTHQWLVGDAYSVADIAMFAYSHMAPDAGHDLSQFPALSLWMARFRAQPGWFALE